MPYPLSSCILHCLRIPVLFLYFKDYLARDVSVSQFLSLRTLQILLHDLLVFFDCLDILVQYFLFLFQQEGFVSAVFFQLIPLMFENVCLFFSFLKNNLAGGNILREHFHLNFLVIFYYFRAINVTVEKSDFSLHLFESDLLFHLKCWMVFFFIFEVK